MKMAVVFCTIRAFIAAGVIIGYPRLQSSSGTLSRIYARTSALCAPGFAAIAITPTR